jgi:hypothetical protein
VVCRGGLGGLGAGQQVLRVKIGALGVGALCAGVAQYLCAAEKVALLNPRTLSGAIGKDFDCLQSTAHLSPPDAVVWLLEMRFLAEIENRKQDETGSGYSQHRRLQAVEEARFHGNRSTS